MEVGPRDGLQNEKGIIPTATKVQPINTRLTSVHAFYVYVYERYFGTVCLDSKHTSCHRLSATTQGL